MKQGDSEAIHILQTDNGQYVLYMATEPHTNAHHNSSYSRRLTESQSGESLDLWKACHWCNHTQSVSREGKHWHSEQELSQFSSSVKQTVNPPLRLLQQHAKCWPGEGHATGASEQELLHRLSHHIAFGSAATISLWSCSLSIKFDQRLISASKMIKHNICFIVKEVKQLGSTSHCKRESGEGEHKQAEQ